MTTHARTSKISATGQLAQVEQYRPIVKALQAAFADRLRAVILFGSQARQEARHDSDHDLLVVIEGIQQDPLARNRLVRSTLLPILDRLPGAVGVVVKTPDEVEAYLTPLLLDVCTEGVCLSGEDYFEPLRRKALAALHSSGLRRRTVGGVRMWVFPKMPSGDWELSWEGFREGI